MRAVIACALLCMATAAPVQPHAASRATRSTTCKDIHPSCAAYKNWGLCSYAVIKTTWCKQSCGACPSSHVPADARDAFTFIFVSDLEEQYRGHTEQDVKDVMYEIVNLNSGRVEMFGGEYTGVRIKPELVIHGGDLYENDYVKKRDTAAAMLQKNGIPYISTDGNHDEPTGVTSNAAFADDTPIIVTVAGGRTATFKGLQIGVFAYTKNGPSRYQVQAMKDELGTAKPTVVINHVPGDNTENGGQNGNIEGWVKTLPHGSAVFSGHTHQFKKREIDGGHTEYTAPYPHQWGSLDYGNAKTLKERAMLAVLVSPTAGVLNVKKIDTRLRSRYYPDGRLCGKGTTCKKCRNGHAYWWGKAMTACGSEPKWGDGTRCLAGTSCHACRNSYSWWNAKFGHHCGSEPGAKSVGSWLGSATGWWR